VFSCLQLAKFDGQARALVRHARLRAHQRVALLRQLLHAHLRARGARRAARSFAGNAGGRCSNRCQNEQKRIRS
jgi:hypothetical protein